MTEPSHSAPPRAVDVASALNLFRAEWIKIGGNRWVVTGLIWIFPITVTAFIAITALLLTLDAGFRDTFTAEPYRWTDMAIGVWNVPNNPFLRIILLGFVATAFAGEYQWGTWKNALPRNGRTALILTKFFTVGVYVLVAFGLTSLILTLGWGVLLQIADAPYGPKLTSDVLTDFVQDYAVQASTSFTTTIISAGYAALAGMITRSILGSLLVSFILTALEMVSLAAFALAGWLLYLP
ncbi:MAG: ABC transporter permease [Anaerolineae bacterium]|nr:ABC transporter permease [Anaerolineae bacterium]